MKMSMSISVEERGEDSTSQLWYINVLLSTEKLGWDVVDFMQGGKDEVRLNLK